MTPIAAKESFIRVHLIPQLGTKKLDLITNEDVQQLKSYLHERASSTVNTILTTLSVMLKTAVECGVIERVPCAMKLLRVPPNEAALHDFDDYERLVEVAKALGRNAHIIVLLGGEAGLRMG